MKKAAMVALALTSFKASANFKTAAATAAARYFRRTEAIAIAAAVVFLKLADASFK